jgi:hypothetical protein
MISPFSSTEVVFTSSGGRLGGLQQARLKIIRHHRADCAGNLADVQLVFAH